MPAAVFVNRNIHVELHPAARSAYEWCMQYPQRISWSDLPQPIITGLSKEPLRGVMIKEEGTKKDNKSARHFMLYSPLWSIQLWPSTRPPNGTLLVSLSPQEISDEEVETAAWLSALSPLLLSVDHHQTAEIRDALVAHMPVKVHQKLLRAKVLSDPMLCRWLNISRGTLVQQRQRKVIREDEAIAEVPQSTDELIAALKKTRSPDD
ncbi:hypothetical protein [Oceanisphaera pacifica]|uniref:Uncharacterized protein n=1 Tax=Oceanisphaera pacifica TaxID=2818389 RepID=A0ABS3NK73_9GAMM|nr:hypothetical protein [Oceanisphaera pacifica]MBO1520695.1 hypothetical protein [Oceanisphaera pacifica]